MAFAIINANFIIPMIFFPLTKKSIKNNRYVTDYTKPFFRIFLRKNDLRFVSKSTANCNSILSILYYPNSNRNLWESRSCGGSDVKLHLEFFVRFFEMHSKCNQISLKLHNKIIRRYYRRILRKYIFWIVTFSRFMKRMYLTIKKIVVNHENL